MQAVGIADYPEWVALHPPSTPAEQMISVKILADPSLHRDCLEEVLRGRNDLEVVATAGIAEHRKPVEREVAVVLVDHSSSGALSAVRHLCCAREGPPAVVYGVPETEHHVVEYFEAGAAGIVLNGESVDDLVLAVEGATRSEIHCKPRVAAMLARRLHDVAVERRTGQCASTLTERELDIVELLDKGFSNKEIAHRLDIKVATVKNHVHSILSKLNVSRRGEAAALLHGRLPSPTVVERPVDGPDSDRPD